MKSTLSVMIVLVATLGAVTAEELSPAGWVLLPAIGSSPETGFQYGAYVMRQFEQTDIDEPQDRLELLLQGTSKGQYQAYLWPNYFVAGGDWNLTGKLGGMYWPTPYYGQSNDIDPDDEKEVYDLTSFDGEFGAAYRVTPSLRIGGLVFVEREDVVDDPDNALLDDSVRGFDGGLYSGVGLTASWDTRDDRDWPTHGFRIASELRQYTGYLGSDADFVIFDQRASHFIPIGDDVVALGLNYGFGGETTPFTRLPRPNGAKTLRAANGNLWTDHHRLGSQAEYRMTLTPRWAVTGFLDTAQVAPTLDELGLDRFHTSVGGGIRYATLAGSRFNIRADVGIVDGEHFNFAISVGEAF